MSANKFTDEFKRDAVVQVEDRAYAVRAVAERLGTSTKSIYTWQKQFSWPTKVIPEGDDPVILLHGFPYDTVSANLAGQGFRCLVPCLRGYGPTRFLSSDTMRSGQQAALGADLLAFMDALFVKTAFLGGYD